MAGFPTNGDDDIIGTEGVDYIDALDGNDEVDGAGGDDQITGGAGFDLIYGGAGNDYLTGGAGGDLVYGGEGDDILVEAGKFDDFDILDGGAGRDQLSVTSGYANMYGGEDDDLLRIEGDAYGYADGGDGVDAVFGGAYDDEIRGGLGWDTLGGGGGFDVFSGDLAELNGDTIVDYAYGETIRVHNASLSAEQVQLINNNGSSYLAIDGDGDGVFETRIGFVGEVTGQVQLGGDPDYNTLITIVEDGGYGTPSEGADYLVGTSGADVIDALGGNDEVQGRGGDDQLAGGFGDDYLDGGDGNDVIEGGDGFDQLFGGEGDDTLTDAGADWGFGLLYGGGGADLLDFSSGEAELWGEDGDDTLRMSGEARGWLYGGYGADILVGGAYDDVLGGGGEADRMTGGAGKDIFEGMGFELDGDVITDYVYGETIRLQATVTGSPGAVVLEAAGADSLLKIDEDGDGIFEATVTLIGVSAGAVVLSTELYSNNTLIRIVDPNGSGVPTEDADFLVGTAADDVIDAGYGDDEVLGLAGADTLYGGGGDDQLNGGEGDDHLDGGEGRDLALGGEGNDVLTDTGMDGAYTDLYGGAGADTLSVHSGHGWLYGEDGDDLLFFTGVGQGYANGGAGNDVLVGGDRADRLVGGEGADILTGGGAKDYFEDYSWNVNGDVVTDFQFGESFYFFSWIDNPQTVQLLQAGADTLLKLDFDGNGVFETTITLEGVSGGRIQLYNNYVFIEDGAAVANTAPTGADRTVAVTEDGVRTLRLSDFGYSDANGHSLASVTVVTPPQGTIYVGGVALAAGQAISAADLFAGNVTYRPAPNDNGPAGDSFTFQVTDTGSGANTDLTPNRLTFSIAAVNDAPTASGAASLAAAAEDSAPAGASVASLFAANFNDAADQVAGGSGGHAFAGVAVVGYVPNAAQGVWQYSANGGTSWTALPATLSDQSALLLNGGALLRFLPAADFNGTPPALTVRLVDGSLGTITSPATVNLGAVGGTSRYSAGTVTLTTSIAPVNDAPTAPAAQAFSLLEDGQASVVIGAADKDGDALAFSLEVAPTHGTVTFTANGYIYTPNANYSGEDAFVVRIFDGQAFVLQSATATIAPVNDAPTAPATRAVTTAEDTATGHILIGAADPEGSPVSFSLKDGEGPQHGAVAFTDAGFVYTPGANYNGADTFTVVISDGQLTTEQVVSVTVTPVNDAPVLVQPLPDQDARQGTPFALNLAQAFADADGALTITATQASGAALPSWLTVSNGVLSGTPTGTEDLVSIRVTARDASGATVTDTIDLYIGRVFGGSDKNDRYTGGRGDDFIYGGKGADDLNGAAGDDWIDGGLGDDKFTGGLGSDVFAVGYREGADRINDLQVGFDHIHLGDGVAALGWSTVKGNTVIQLSGGGSITLVGVTGLTQSGFEDLFV